MIDVVFFAIQRSFNIPVFTTAASDDPAAWGLFLFIFIICSIGALIITLNFSKKAEDWQHKSAVGDYYASGRFKDLAESIRLTPIDFHSTSPLKNLIETAFYERIRSTRGLSDKEIQEIFSKNKNVMDEIIQDKEIVDWILNIRKKEEKWISRIFNKSKISKKEQYLMDINSILDKMEVWGE